MADVKHTSGYFTNSDIDWFCRINGVNVHFASMGRKIPDIVMNSLPKVYEVVSKIEMARWQGSQGVWYNEGIVKEWLHIENDYKIARYLYTFVVMARKGFYSFAPITFDSTDFGYYLMAKPMEYKDLIIEGIQSIENPSLRLSEIDAYTALNIKHLFE